MTNSTPNPMQRNSIEDNKVKDTRNIFRLKKDVCIKEKIIDIKTLFESDEEDYYKPVRTGNAFSRITLNINARVIKIKCSDLKNFLRRIYFLNKTIIEWHDKLS